MPTLQDRITEINRIMNEWPASNHREGVLRVVQAMQEEIELAKAHDTQAYPTAEAYENVCAALAVVQRRPTLNQARCWCDETRRACAANASVMMRAHGLTNVQQVHEYVADETRLPASLVAALEEQEKAKGEGAPSELTSGSRASLEPAASSPESLLYLTVATRGRTTGDRALRTHVRKLMSAIMQMQGVVSVSRDTTGEALTGVSTHGGQEVPPAPAPQEPNEVEVTDSGEEIPRPYFIEADDTCPKCGVIGWNIMEPDGMAGGVTYDSEDDAEEMADALNDAWGLGWQAGKTVSDMKHVQHPSLASPSPLDSIHPPPDPAPLICRQCGGACEEARRCYAIPTCYRCLPPPPPIEPSTYPRGVTVVTGTVEELPGVRGVNTTIPQYTGPIGPPHPSEGPREDPENDYVAGPLSDWEKQPVVVDTLPDAPHPEGVLTESPLQVEALKAALALVAAREKDICQRLRALGWCPPEEYAALRELESAIRVGVACGHMPNLMDRIDAARKEAPNADAH